jgi:hypothetical protein
MGADDDISENIRTSFDIKLYIGTVAIFVTFRMLLMALYIGKVVILVTFRMLLMVQGLRPFAC